MKTWMMTLLACSLAMGCIEESSSTDDSGVTDPEPSPPEPEAQPEPQPEAQPEPQPEAQPEPQPEAQPEPQPDSPEPDSPEPDSPEPDSPEPDSPEPDSPEPDSPEPDSPEPDSPEPDSPEPDPEPEGPVDNCAEACARIDLCFERECDTPAGTTAAFCAEICGGQPGVVVAVVSGAADCADLVNTVRTVAPEAGALCDAPDPDPEPEGPIDDCADACGRIDQCLISECGAAPGTFGAQCAEACADFGEALPAIVAGIDQCGDLVEQLRGLSDEIDAICDEEPPPPPPENCLEACAYVEDCFAQECRPLSPEDARLCAESCDENGDILVALINGDPRCGSVVELLTDLSPDLAQLCDERLACEDVCDRLLTDCVGDPNNAGERAACLEGCNEANPSQAQLECAFTAECAEVELCEQLEPPPGDDVAAECADACAFVIACEGQGIPPEEALQQCQVGCEQESTPEERACVLGLDNCNQLPACFDAP